MRSLAETGFTWATGTGAMYLANAGHVIQVAFAIVLGALSIAQGYISIQRFLWDLRDRRSRDHRGRRRP